ncbi:hypothetical protein DRP44_01725 [candidate division TA06 bacterium]|uniref:Ion-translocating oxidoreductase complex subunit G n=1 Tax=candidate division TA06 bacterium TaxID=2250710 RepID=A0A660SA07_UNCT6|nr:MAG: hypothetical protein DRP44_01725 [candidate division TA06 bacterium]
MNNGIKMVLSLTVVCALAGVILAETYAVTNKKIENDKKQAVIDNLSTVIKADHFEQVIPDTLWYALGEENDTIGIVFMAFGKGFGGTIDAIVGMNNEGKLTGVKITPSKETPGLGVKTGEPKFMNQFKGKTLEELKITKDGGKIEAVTAATISSRGATNGIHDAVEKYMKYLPQKEVGNGEKQ